MLEYVIDKVNKQFSEDMDLVTAYGSYVSGTDGSRSDVDVVMIVNSDRGYSAVENFIIDGVGYDIWATSWERLEQIVKLEDRLTPIVGYGDVVWSRPGDSEGNWSLKCKLLQRSSGESLW